MANIILKSMEIQNFKGISNREICFSDSTNICGANATGKTTVFDALTWLLFDKDSLGNSKFEIRPLDSDGNKIHNVEISVCAVLEVDGKEISLKKVQKEKWVKKRGSDTAELQGNDNSFEIDGFPKSARDYQAFVDELVKEDLFKMLTNSAYFPNMKWQEQRKVLMGLVDNQTDAELAQSIGGFDAIIDDLERADSLDDIKKKYQKATTEYKKKQAEIPVRIDELAKGIVTVDLKALSALQTKYEDALRSIQDKYEEISVKNAEKRELESQIMEIRFEQELLVKDYNSASAERRNNLSKTIDNKKADLYRQNGDLKVLNAQREADVSLLETIDIQGKAINDEYKAESNAKFSGDDTCPYCGQKMPSEHIQKAMSAFEKRKAENLATIKKKALNLKEQKNKTAQKIEQTNQKIVEMSKSVNILECEIAKLEFDLKELPADVSAKDIPEWREKQAEIDARTDILNQPMPYDINELKREEDIARTKIAEISSQLSQTERNGEINSRIDILRKEQVEVAQKVADCERMQYLLETFIKAKMETVADAINSKFDGLNFKLFDVQINGGIRECCELTVNGVPYSSLNNGHRIVSGLEIIKTLQSVFGTHAPIFIDNAESVNDFNLPDMDCQIVKLIVTEDERLVIA